MTLGGNMGYIERPRRVVQPGGAAPQQQGSRRLNITGPATGPTTGPATGPTTGGPTAAGPQHRALYQDRSPRLREAVARLDAGLDEAACRELADWIRGEYTHVYGTVPLGFVARCYLGPPYVDHVLNLFQVIVRHYTPGERMPDPYDGARMLARSESYAYVEVYSDGLVLPVLADGTVVRP